jgi:hypothetical protein
LGMGLREVGAGLLGGLRTWLRGEIGAILCGVEAILCGVWATLCGEMAEEEGTGTWVGLQSARE